MTAEPALQRSSSVGAGSLGRQPDSLADVLERVLDKGIVIAGDIVVSILDIELLTLKLRLFVSSAETAREMGLDWWSHDPFFSGRRPERDGAGATARTAVRSRPSGERVAALEEAAATGAGRAHQRTHEDTEGTEALVTGPNDRDALDRIADEVTPEVLAAALEQARERADRAAGGPAHRRHRRQGPAWRRSAEAAAGRRHRVPAPGERPLRLRGHPRRT